MKRKAELECLGKAVRQAEREFDAATTTSAIRTAAKWLAQARSDLAQHSTAPPSHEAAGAS